MLTVQHLLARGHAVCAMVHKEDERSKALRGTGAEVVIGELLEHYDVIRAASGTRTMSVFTARLFWPLDAVADFYTNFTGGATNEMEAMMRQGDNVPDTEKMDYEAWSALLRPLYGRHSLEGGELNTFSGWLRRLMIGAAQVLRVVGSEAPWPAGRCRSQL